jgi:hypothetical protein
MIFLYCHQGESLTRFDFGLIEKQIAIKAGGSVGFTGLRLSKANQAVTPKARL